MSKMLKSILFVIFVFHCSTGGKIPEGLKTCKRSDAKYNECITSTIESTLRQFKDGNKDLGLNPVDPLSIKTLDLEGTGQVSVHQFYKDVKLYGLIDSKIEKFSIDLDKCQLLMTSYSPVIYMAGQYTATGSVLLFQINSHGRSNHTLSELTLEHVIDCELTEKGGAKYINVLNYKVTIKPKHIVFFFDNIIDGNELLSKEVLNTLNENSLSVFEEVRELQEISFGLVFKQLANNVFRKLSVDQLFPK